MSGKLVQYGRRKSTKHNNIPSPSLEPSPKRRKLMADDGDDDDGVRSLSQPTAKSSANVEGKHTNANSHPRTQHTRIIPNSTPATPSPTRTYSSKSKAKGGLPPKAKDGTPPRGLKPEDNLSSNVADVGTFIPTRPNTPTRSPSPATVGHLLRTPSQPKDLSGIFEALSQLSPQPLASPKKSVTKRMLVRSQTEPSSPSSSRAHSSPGPTITPTRSLPNVASTSIQPVQGERPPPSPTPVITNPGIRTYSQSRSFLVALPATMASHHIPAATNSSFDIGDSAALPDDELRESYTDLRTRWGVDHSEDDPHHVPGVTNDLMSITELRSKGESRRFLDEVGYLFEGLLEPDMAVNVRRSSAAEIVQKMCDAEFMRKAKAADFVGHAWDAMRHAGAGDGDKVLNPYLVFFTALVAREKRDVDDLSRKKDFFGVMIRLLQTRKEGDGLGPLDDAHARKSSFAKTERVALSSLRNVIVNKSELLKPYSHLSTRLLASYTLSRITPSSYPDQLFSVVLASLIEELILVRPRLDAYISGLALLPSAAPDIPDLEHIDQCLRILDTFLLGQWAPSLGKSQLNAEQKILCDGLVALSAALASLGSENEQHVACQCLESAFRVLINLSHLNAEWCRLLVTAPLFLPVLVQEIISQFIPTDVVKLETDEVETGAVDSKTNAMDRQCLALALLSNVVFAVEEAKDLLRETILDPACAGGRRCISSCRCTGRTNAIECLVSFFSSTSLKIESPNASELDFFRCHLAALVCLVTVANPTNRGIVLRSLPGSNLTDKTRSLGSSIRLFIEFYAEASTIKPEDKEDGLLRQILLALEALGINHIN
ncbi:hypothetical protein K439DRAFT_1413240 [Ramaria rubella]|nr:hypothetical protein K439DRAFT_1413240 [Ramaria rubella]